MAKSLNNSDYDIADGQYSIDPQTGYLVGTLDRFNNAKKAEVSDRVTHGTK